MIYGLKTKTKQKQKIWAFGANNQKWFQEFFFSVPSKLKTLQWTLNSHITLDSAEVIPTQILVGELFQKFYHIFFKTTYYEINLVQDDWFTF